MRAWTRGGERMSVCRTSHTLALACDSPQQYQRCQHGHIRVNMPVSRRGQRMQLVPTCQRRFGPGLAIPRYADVHQLWLQVLHAAQRCVRCSMTNTVWMKHRKPLHYASRASGAKPHFSMTPGRKFSTNTSAFCASRRACTWPPIRKFATLLFGSSSGMVVQQSPPGPAPPPCASRA